MRRRKLPAGWHVYTRRQTIRTPRFRPRRLSQGEKSLVVWAAVLVFAAVFSLSGDGVSGVSRALEAMPKPPYRNCAAARAAGAAPVRSDHPRYGKHLDSDGDGIGCEWAR